MAVVLVDDRDEVRDLAGLYAASYRRLVVQMFAICGDLADAEDAVQEAFITALRKRRTLEAVQNPEAWIRTVALHRLHRGWRHRGVVRRHQTEARPPEPSDDVGPEHVALVTALGQLDPGQREAWGRYRIALGDTLALDVSVPDDTYAHDDGLFLANGPVILKTELAGPGYGVPRDRCGTGPVVPVGPTVDDLVDAMREQTAYYASEPQPVRIGGASGTYLAIQLRPAPRCKGDVRMPGTNATTVALPPMSLGRWWILDVDGQRVVVQQNCTCGNAPMDRLARMPRGITFATTGQDG